MKRIFLFLGTIALVSVITWTLKAQSSHQMDISYKPQPPKTYSVSLTNEQWISVLNGLESIKSAVKLSRMPANESTFICDSLILIYQIEFNRQINSQKEAEKSAQQKKDTTIKSKKQ